MGPQTLRFCLPVCALIAFAAPAYAKTVTVEPGDGTPIADAVAQLADGDKLIVKPGTYTEGVFLTGLSKVKVIGKGDPVLSPPIGLGIAVTDCARVTIQGIIFDQGGNTGVQILRCTDVTLKDCRVESTAINGVRIFEGARVKLVKCIIANCLCAISISEVERPTILGCSISDCRTGVTVGDDLTLTTDAVIKRNRVTNLTGGAFNLASLRTICQRNTVDGASFGVITVLDTDMTGSVISRNRISNVEITAYAIQVRSRGVTVSKNTVSGDGAFGIRTTAEAEPVVVTGNKVSGFDTGLFIVMDDAVVRKNRVNGCRVGVRADAGADGTPGSIFARNKVQDSTFGFFVLSVGNTFTRNKASDSTDTDLLSVEAESENTYVKNKFGTTEFN